MSKPQIALVTGATRGIGKAITLQLLQAGYTVYGVYRQAAEKAKELGANHKNLHMLQADIAQESDIQSVIKIIEEKHGYLNVLVNNAGMDIFGPIREYKSADWDTMMNVNLKSVFLFSKLAIPLMEKAESGVMVNITSRLGIPERAKSPYLVYGVAKAGVTTFTVGLSKELEPSKIRVNAIVPPATETDLLYHVLPKEKIESFRASGDLGQPDEVATLVMQLVNDTSANGKILFDKRIA